MILNLFSLPVYRTSLLESGIDFDKIRSVLMPLFEQSKTKNVNLERQGGISTYWVDGELHKREEFKKLSFLILEQAKLYWKILDIRDTLEPEIEQCWSNLHTPGAFTEQHSHSLMPMVGSFYLDVPDDSGNIVFINPMEYGLTHIPYNGSIENKIETAVHVSSGDLCMFPGWVRHKTENNNSNKNRIVITFNIRYKGTYLQSNSEYPNMYKKLTSHEDQLINQVLTQQRIIEEFKKVR